MNYEEIEITSLYFRQGSKRRGFEGYPRRMVWGGREYTFIESGIEYLVHKGQQLIKLFDMTDGQTLFRLRLEGNQWTLVSTKAGY